MNKREFLDALRKALYGLPDEDIGKSLDFYAEMIDDRIEDGLSEQEAVVAIGDPQEIAKQILSDISITKLVKQKIKPKRRLSVLEIALLILGSPIWLSLLIAAIAIVLSLYVSLWSVIISLYAVAISVAACSIAGVACFAIYMIAGRLAEGAFMLGVGLVCIGLAILMFFAFNQIAKGLLWASKKIWFLIKYCFIKGDVK